MMRRSFGGGSGGMGGGGAGNNGGGGGGMLRAVQRAVRKGGTFNGAAQESFSHSTTSSTAKTSTSTSHAFHNKKGSNSSTALCLSSSSPFSTLPLSSAALAPAATWDSSTYKTDESEYWKCLDGCEDERVNNIVFDDYILGPVPSTDEVQHAVSALQQVLEPSYFSCSSNNSLGDESNEDTTDELTSSINLTREVLSSSGSVSDWIEPSMHICNSKLVQSYGSNRVYDAFHLLQTEPSIQKMVISLSSDKAVWDAVLNNEAVREIRDSLKPVDAADNGLPAGSSEEDLGKSDSDGTLYIISWIVVNTKEKVMGIVEKIIEVVNEWFQPPEKEKTSEGNTDPFEEKLRTSFFLSVVVLLVVVVARAQCA